MMIIVFILLVIIVIVAFGGNNSKKKPYSNYNRPVQKKSAYQPKITVEIKTSSSRSSDSIIEVTGRPYRIESSANPLLKKSTKRVPYWQHQYVYSFSEINAASNEQKAFYKLLKEGFLKGEYLDVEGNLNYAFVLFFDVLDEFLKHKDLGKVEQQLDILGQCYPKITGYAIPELIKRLEIIGDRGSIERLRDKQQAQYSATYESWKLGSKFKAQLKLSDREVSLLNKVWQPSNNFGSIEYCCVQIVKLYLKTLSELDKVYQQENSNFEEQLISIADLVARKHHNYRSNSTNYKYSLDQTKDQVYSTIFKYCENVVREIYGHKRKLSIDFYDSNSIVQQEFRARISSKVEIIHSNLMSQVELPDEKTEVELNSQNTSRWKITFEKITERYKGDTKYFSESIHQLAALNSKNPSLENIYFEASKYIAKSDKQCGLQLYLHYLYADLQSSKFDNKQLTKTVQKSLFNSDAQLKEFEKIVNDLVNTKDLKNALEACQKFYSTRRKKIELNKDAIAEAHQKHSGTVELLNEYLQDENELRENIGSKNDKEGEVNIQISALETVQAERSESTLKAVQRDLLEIFRKNGLTLASAEVDSFAKSRGLFKNQLVESINDTCYGELDDVLIEEEEESYSISSNYFQRIEKL